MGLAARASQFKSCTAVKRRDRTLCEQMAETAHQRDSCWAGVVGMGQSATPLLPPAFSVKMEHKWQQVPVATGAGESTHCHAPRKYLDVWFG